VCEVSLFYPVTTISSSDTPYIHHFLQHVVIYGAIVRYFIFRIYLYSYSSANVKIQCTYYLIIISFRDHALNHFHN
jgi:hypothetical protein